MEKALLTRSGNTYTFVYLELGAEIKKSIKPYVCICSDCEMKKYARFMHNYEDKENIDTHKNR